MYIYTVFVYYSIMSKHNKKYIQVINTARDLFCKHGIRRVTVEEICVEAGVSKMTFYKFFTNKVDLVKHLLVYIYEDGLLQYRSIMDSDKPYSEKVTELIKMKIEATNDMSHEFLNDYYSMMDTDLKDFIQELTEKNNSIILADFIIAQEAGNIRKDLKPEFIIYFMSHLATLVKDQALNDLYPDPQEMIREVMNVFFYGIMSVSKS